MENKKPWDDESQRDSKGRFVQGTKVAGRPPGAQNATAKEIRQIWTNVVNDHLPQVYADLAAMKPEKRLMTLVAVSNMILPKFSAIAVADSETANRMVSTIIDWSEPEGIENTTKAIEPEPFVPPVIDFSEAISVEKSPAPVPIVQPAPRPKPVSEPKLYGKPYSKNSDY